MQHIAICVDGSTIMLEYGWIGRERQHAPLIVFLHEGLGSAAMWNEWPATLCSAAGCRGLVFSRYGYGHSQVRPASGQAWPVDYMEREACELLPALLDALGIDAKRERLIIFGHSDGATIALLYAAAFPQHACAIVALAPHVFTEQIARERIGQLRANWEDGRLSSRLARLHDDPGGVFDGWSRRWLAPAFDAWNVAAAIETIASPLLVIQGRGDQFGSLEQLREIQRRAPHAELLVLEDCRHVPHEEQPELTLRAVTAFLARCREGEPARRGV